MTYYRTLETPLCALLLTATADALDGLYMLPSHQHGPEIQPDWIEAPEHAVLNEATRQLTDYFAGTRTQFDLPLAPHGTDFQRRVWAELTRIPYGLTISYGELAARIGNPKASRAVGLANGQNPLSIVVPCHRVIGASGKLVGYGGGLERKRLLLDFEAAVLANGPTYFRDESKSPSETSAAPPAMAMSGP